MRRSLLPQPLDLDSHHCTIVSNCFSIIILPVSRSISRKISAQYTLDDEIDFDDLNMDDDSETQVSSNQSSDTVDVTQGTVSSITNTAIGVSRRESRGVSQVGIIMTHSIKLINL